MASCACSSTATGLGKDSTIVSLLKICAKRKDLNEGIKIHAHILRRGILEKDIYVGTTLISFYARCGALVKAQEVLDQLTTRNVVSWTALIAGYVQYGHAEDALNCFNRMRNEGFSPDARTFVCILKACGIIRATCKGQEIHSEIIREGLLEKDVMVGGALVDMYVKCGALSKAHDIFDELPIQNLVSWTTLIMGYVQHGDSELALNCFEQMRCSGFCPDASTFVCILKACGNIGAIEKGLEIHGDILRERLLKENILVGTALLEMYSKCGALGKAQGVFDELPIQDVVTWTVLLAGYAQHGKHDIVVEMFNKMITQQIQPNLVTFTVVLNACRHAGLIEKGEMYFETMSTCYGILPTLEHHACMVDLFGRAGHFDKALAVIEKMPTSDYFPVWTALLGACQNLGDLKLGRMAFEHAIQLDEKNPIPYVCMRNMYADAAMQLDADKIEAMRIKHGAC